jgi:serine protease Do
MYKFAMAATDPTVVTIEISKNITQEEIIYAQLDLDFFIPIDIQPVTVNKKTGVGSGFIISHNGFVATNKHVVLDPTATYTVVLNDGVRKPAKVYYRDPNNDVAVLKIDGIWPTIARLSTDMLLNEPVSALGNAYGIESNAISSGKIIGFNKNVTASDREITEKLSGLIQTSVHVVPGFSGGPLVDNHGNVIGINVAADAGKNNSSFAVPIRAIYQDILPYTLN